MSVWAAGVWCVVSFGFVSFSLGEVLEAWGGVLDERCETQRNASHGFTGRVQGCTVADSLPCGTAFNALPFCVDFFHGLHLSCKPVKAPRKVESLTC